LLLQRLPSPQWKRKLSPDYIRLPIDPSVLVLKDLWVVRLGVGEANEISPVGKYLRCGRRVIRFRSQTQRGEPGSTPCSMPHSKQAKSMGRHPSAPARHSGLKCIGKRFPKNIFIFKKNKCKLPLSFISLC